MSQYKTSFDIKYTNELDEFLQNEVLPGLDNISIKIFFSVTLILAGLNSILAGWQIAGDYAEKFGLNQKFLVSITAIISFSYVVFGGYLILT